MRSVLSAATAVAAMAAVPAFANPVLMSGDWTKGLCQAWNAEPVLTDKLAESGWAKNDKGRGFKVIQIYRTDCGKKPTSEVRISLKEGKAACVYGGPAESTKLDMGADYVMDAETTRWEEMGRGEYGPMRAMMFGRLSFDGPMGEAMGNMGPFEAFLKLVGKVPYDVRSCAK
ncbi:MAG: SCP2 sterol-binding domain-containing protein [Betaproteobacteria bacterium]|nr:SCP2 sterol-binding domain-containing protein [Betaproteobacteria bacterium]